jgi:hypothetical protein
MAVAVWAYVQIFYSIGLCVCFYASTLVFFDIMALQYSLKSGIMIPPVLIFLLWIALAV